VATSVRRLVLSGSTATLCALGVDTTALVEGFDQTVLQQLRFVSQAFWRGPPRLGACSAEAFAASYDR
jgi:hypothetical protein